MPPRSADGWMCCAEGTRERAPRGAGVWGATPEDVALKLVEVYGANLALRTRSGETVVQIAEKGGYLKLAAELSSRVEAKGAPAALL